MSISNLGWRGEVSQPDLPAAHGTAGQGHAVRVVTVQPEPITSKYHNCGVDQSQLTWTAARRPSRTAWRRRSPRTTSCVPRRGRRAAAGAAVWRARATGSGTWPCRGPRAAARPRRGAWAAASAGRPQPRSWGASVTSHQQRPNMSSVSAVTFIGLETKDVLGLSQFPPTAVVSYSDSVTCLSRCAEAHTRKKNDYQ